MLDRPPPPPRWATPRTPSRRSYGAAIAKVAQAMGKPLQAWQRRVVDVATELLPDGSWAYRTVVVHVQRQAGKTTLLGPKNVHRCLVCNGAKTWLTAQTRQDGRDTWRDIAELVGRSPLAGLVTTRRSNGSEELAVASTGSSFRVFAPTEDALHGKANESVDVDEGWAFDHAQGLALEQAILPTFTTTGGQLWLTSTAGTGASTWLRGYIDRGRQAAAAGRTEGIAFFEWSLTPAEAEQVSLALTELQQLAAEADDAAVAALLDPALDVVLARHPGEFVRRDSVRGAALGGMPPGEFLRAYGNVWTLTADRAISDHAWTTCRDRQLAPPDPGQLALSYDVSVDRSHAAIGGAWRTGHQPAVDVLDDRAGTSWLVERIEQLAERYRCDEVGYDGAGPALDIADELERRGRVKPRRLTTREYVAACGGYKAAIDAAQLRHRDTASLNQAVAAAATRQLGDSWAWSRRTSAGSIAGLVATTVALWTLDHQAEPAPRPMIVAGRGTARPSRLVLQ